MLHARAEGPFPGKLSGTADGEFIFLNVAPGVHLIQWVKKSTGQGFAQAILVRPGHVTFADAPLIRAQTLRGRVLDARSTTPHGVAKVAVTVVGQDGLTAITDSQGRFQIEGVLTSAGENLYLDAISDEKSFRHRYRIANPSEELGLFWFTEEEVNQWVSQLEGGISSASGLVIGAFPGLASEVGAALDGRLLPLSDANLKPELYGLGAGNELLESNQLSASQSRLIGVQVPEGPNLLTFLNSRGESVYSEILVAQPGVINVVGPY